MRFTMAMSSCHELVEADVDGLGVGQEVAVVGTGPEEVLGPGRPVAADGRGIDPRRVDAGGVGDHGGHGDASPRRGRGG